MERKTTVHAEQGRQDLLIVREFELPVDLLFEAYVDPEVLGEWMGTRVLKLESSRHGSYQFETADALGNIVFRASGTIHDCIPDSKIVRTFEMENTPFGVQLELLSFEQLNEGSSKLTIHAIYESAEQRDQVLRLPFVHGISMAHDRLENCMKLRR